MDKLKKVRDLKKMRDQANSIQKQLAEIDVMVEEGDVEVIVRADQKITSVKIAGEEQEKVVKALNKALKKAQDKAAKRMQGMMGDLSSMFG